MHKTKCTSMYTMKGKQRKGMFTAVALYLQFLSLLLPFLMLLAFGFAPQAILLSALSAVWLNVGISFKTRMIFGKKLSRKALTKLGIYALILSFLIFYQLYFFGSSRIVLAFTVLQPGEATFTISPMVIDYLKLTGEIDYLNVLWKARYWDLAERNISVECYLNCPDPQAGCSAYQNCKYLDYPAGAAGSCTIANPNYDLTPAAAMADRASTVLNKISCKFTDPKNPVITSGWVNKEFAPIAFYLEAPSAIALTAGDEFPLELVVKNLGILTDSYSVAVRSLASNLIVSDGQATITNIKANETGRMRSVLLLLSTVEAANAKVNVTSIISPQINLTKTILVQSGMKSLPEFNWFGMMQIMFLAAVILAFKFKR